MSKRNIILFYFYLVFIGPYRKKTHILISLSLRGRRANNDKGRFQQKESLPRAEYSVPSMTSIMHPLLVVGTCPEREDCTSYRPSYSHTRYSYRLWSLFPLFFSVLSSHEITSADARKPANVFFEDRFMIPIVS